MLPSNDSLILGILRAAVGNLHVAGNAWASPIWYTPDPSLVERLDFYPGLEERLPPDGFNMDVMDFR